MKATPTLKRREVAQSLLHRHRHRQAAADATSAPTLELRDIRKSFGATQVIHGVDLQIQHGEFIVFVGPSGCGKSTLLRLIAGLEDPTTGDILINGGRVNDIPSSERGLSMVFQSYALYPHMSVRRNLTFGLENTRMPKKEIDQRMADAAALLQIEELLDRRPGQLSGGQRQRVAIGRAIVREPIVFLFDEPLSNLDAELRMQMRVEISNLHADLGNTMIYVTHDQIEALTMADRIVVLRDGLVEQVGKPLDLYNQPANKFVAGFIGAPRMNFLAGKITTAGETRVVLDCGHARAIHPTQRQTDRAVTVGIRPEDFEVSTESAGDITVRVNNFEQLGSVTYIYTELANGEKLTVQLPRQVPLARNQELQISFPDSSVHVFRDDNEQAIELEA